MSTTNRELARMLNRIADTLELQGEGGFRIAAYRRAARTLTETTEDAARLDDEERLREIPGIGSGIARKIHEYLTTGRMLKYEEATASLPESLLSLLELQGMGPKTLRLLHERLDVNSLTDLKQVLKSGAAADLPGMGPGKVTNLSRAVRLREMTGDRMYLNEALALAASVIGHMRPALGRNRIACAGSLRRGRETVGDVDILTTSRNPQRVIDRFTCHPDIRQTTGAGDTKASVMIETGPGLRQVDLRVVGTGAWGAALQYFTGSKDHNVRLRGIARRKGLKISEYGVFKGDRKIAGSTERSVYSAVGLPWIEPELREDRGEFEAATDNTLPRLVKLTDIHADLHMHTKLSDGNATPEAMIEACRARGYTHMAIADHSVSAHYAGGLDRDRLLRHCDWVDRFNARTRGFRVLKASEVDITPSGEMDYPDDVLGRLDLVIASIHQGFRTNATERMCGALAHPLVHIVAHPTGRIIGRREGYAIDLDRVIECAARHGKILEINAFYGRLDLNDTRARQAKAAGVKLAINTDAHAVEDLDWMQYGVKTARRAWLEKKDVVNTLTLNQLLKLLKSIRGD